MGKILNRLLLSLVIIPSSIGYGYSGEDNFRKALEYTYLNNPDLIIARKSLESTNESLVQAKASRYPSVSLSASSQRSYTSTNNDFDTESDTNTIRVGGEYTLFSSGRIISGVRASEDGIRSARFSLKSQEQQTLLSSIKAYLDVARDRKLTEISENNLKVIGEQVDAIKNRFALGSATRTDLAEREAAFESAKAEHSARKGALISSEEVYKTQIGIEAPKTIMEPEDMPKIPDNLGEAMEIGLAKHPLILTAMADFLASREQYKQIRASRGLNVTISGAIQNSDSNSLKGNTGSIGISASIPIFSGGNLVSRQRQGLLAMESAQVRLSKQKRLVEQNIEIGWNNLKVSEATVEARLLQVGASSLAYDGIKKEFELGARSNLELSIAEQNLLRSRSDLTSAERDVKFAVYSLLASIGKLDAISMELDVEPFDPELKGPKLTPMEKDKVYKSKVSNPLREILNNLGSLVD